MSSIEVTFARIYDQAVKLLARRTHGRRELVRKLLRTEGVTPELVERVCDRCQTMGYLDDVGFAESRVRYRLLSCGHGPQRVRAELLALGVAAAAIEEALANQLAEADTTALAAAALVKRYGGTEKASGTLSPKERKKKYDFLARRGFGYEDIHNVLD